VKKDDFFDLDFHDIKPAFPLSRREFLRLMGGGLFIFFFLGDTLAAQEPPRQRRFRQSLPDDFNAFLRIGEDGRVSCFTGKIEMGQGIITSLAQMLADELQVPLDWGHRPLSLGYGDLWFHEHTLFRTSHEGGSSRSPGSSD
jgi:nicotinate dehydrogenase subunit B